MCISYILTLFNIYIILHPYVHCSIVCTSQDMETAQVPPMYEWTKQLQYRYTMKYYSAIKENKILSFATAWMDLDGPVLREICQTNTI